MDIRELRSFVAVVESTSLTDAARRLGYSQSALSHHMKLLQRDVGVVLLARHDRMVMTPAGREFYDCAVTMLAILDEFLVNTRRRASLSGHERADQVGADASFE